MRSGSTLCGDILQASPDVFYVYEPLLYFLDLQMPDRDETFYADIRRRAKAHFRNTKSYIPKPLEFLTYMFNCNLTSYNVEFLTNMGHSKDFNRCKRSIGLAIKNVANATHECVDSVLQRCLNSKAIVQKVLRLSMEEADEYLDQNPSVRIIHLLRDPRGILLSRMHYNDRNTGEMHNNYTRVCERMWNDLSASLAISPKHWGKILTFRYEDLAQDPLLITSIMYKFAGLELLPSVKDFLNQITTSADTLHDLNIAKKTSRENPFATAYHWRQELPFSLVEMVDRDCMAVLEILGYVSFGSEEELRDMKIPAKHKTYGEGLLTPWLLRQMCCQRQSVADFTGVQHSMCSVFGCNRYDRGLP